MEASAYLNWLLAIMRYLSLISLAIQNGPINWLRINFDT